MTAIVDTGFFYALLDADDKNHRAADHLLRSSDETRILLTTVLPEATYLIASRLGYPVAMRFVHTVARSPMLFEPAHRQDIARAAEIMEQYRDARLDFVDCTIMAVAERLGITRLWTFDRRDFSMVRPSHITHFELLP